MSRGTSRKPLQNISRNIHNFDVSRQSRTVDQVSQLFQLESSQKEFTIKNQNLIQKRAKIQKLNFNDKENLQPDSLTYHQCLPIPNFQTTIEIKDKRSTLKNRSPITSEKERNAENKAGKSQSISRGEVPWCRKILQNITNLEEKGQSENRLAAHESNQNEIDNMNVESISCFQKSKSPYVAAFGKRLTAEMKRELSEFKKARIFEKGRDQNSLNRKNDIEENKGQVFSEMEVQDSSAVEIINTNTPSNFKRKQKVRDLRKGENLSLFDKNNLATTQNQDISQDFAKIMENQKDYLCSIFEQVQRGGISLQEFRNQKLQFSKSQENWWTFMESELRKEKQDQKEQYLLIEENNISDICISLPETDFVKKIKATSLKNKLQGQDLLKPPLPEKSLPTQRSQPVLYSLSQNLEGKIICTKLNCQTKRMETQFSNIRTLEEGDSTYLFQVKCRSSGQIYSVLKEELKSAEHQETEKKLEQFKTWATISSKFDQSQPESHLVKCYEAWKEEGFWYTLTEACEFGNLEQYLKQRLQILNKEFLPENELVDILENMALAVSELHLKGQSHSDIKTSSFFVTSENKVKLGNFWNATEDDALKKLKESGFKFDTNKMTPKIWSQIEQKFLSSNKNGLKGDIFNLGISFFEVAFQTKIPKYGNSQNNIFWQEEVNFSQKAQRSKELESLIKWMILPTSAQRPNALEIVQIIQEMKAKSCQQNTNIQQYRDQKEVPCVHKKRRAKSYNRSKLPDANSYEFQRFKRNQKVLNGVNKTMDSDLKLVDIFKFKVPIKKLENEEDPIIETSQQNFLDDQQSSFEFSFNPSKNRIGLDKSKGKKSDQIEQNEPMDDLKISEV